MAEQSGNTRGMKVLRRSLDWPDFHLLVGFLDGRAVAMASVERAGPVARVDHVLTHRPCRPTGYCRAVIDELVRYHRRVLGEVSNPVTSGLEPRLEPRLDDAIECWSAWLAGPT